MSAWRLVIMIRMSTKTIKAEVKHYSGASLKRYRICCGVKRLIIPMGKCPYIQHNILKDLKSVIVERLRLGSILWSRGVAEVSWNVIRP